MQIVNADAIVVKLVSGEYKTIHLSSIRPPRIEGESAQVRGWGHLGHCCYLAHCRLKSSEVLWKQYLKTRTPPWLMWYSGRICGKCPFIAAVILHLGGVGWGV